MRWRREGMPTLGSGYDLAAVVEWLRNDGPWKPRAAGRREEIEQPVSALERERLARAMLREHEYERLLGLWIGREDVHRAFGEVAQSLRSAGELLERHH